MEQILRWRGNWWIFENGVPVRIATDDELYAAANEAY